MHPQKTQCNKSQFSRGRAQEKSMGNLSQNNKRKSDREEIREEADRPMLA
jgi:hypothetical protein